MMPPRWEKMPPWSSLQKTLEAFFADPYQVSFDEWGRLVDIGFGSRKLDEDVLRELGFALPEGFKSDVMMLTLDNGVEIHAKYEDHQHMPAGPGWGIRVDYDSLTTFPYEARFLIYLLWAQSRPEERRRLPGQA